MIVVGSRQRQRNAAALGEAASAGDGTSQRRVVAVDIERATAGIERNAAVRGEARIKTQRPAAEGEPARRIAEIAVRADGKRPSIDRRAPGIVIDARQRERARS